MVEESCKYENIQNGSDSRKAVDMWYLWSSPVFSAEKPNLAENCASV
jgi:hypothetical protein